MKKLRPLLRLRITPVLVFIASIASIGRSQELPADKQQMHLFVLAGQSNMAGRGKLDDRAKAAHPRVFVFDETERWVPATDPLHFDKPKLVGVGLGRTFAEDYADQHPEVTVGLIPCAVGGSPIESWEPGGKHPPTKTQPFDDAIARIRSAVGIGELKGILWHQGESDSNPERSHVYEQKLHALIGRFRTELESERIPFVVGQMGQFRERPWPEDRHRVDTAHQRLPGLVADTAFVPSGGLNHKGDKVHFDTPSFRELGHRYFHAYQSVMADQQSKSLDFQIDRVVAHQGFDGKMCYVHARAGVIPSGEIPTGDESGGEKSNPMAHAVMTTQPLQLSGSDVFYALHQLDSADGGKTWSEPKKIDSFARQRRGDREVTVCDFTPKWHASSRQLLGTGQTVWYEKNRVAHVRPRATAYSVYDLSKERWSPWKRLKMPDAKRFQNAGAGSVQRLDVIGGDILLPIYFKEPEQAQYSTTVCRCSFDGETLTYVAHGSELTLDVKRGLYEPSITRFQGRYFLTMRNDDAGYVSVSDDGMNFDGVQRWTFDDGSDLGSYNTQQHWVTHSDALYLVYTRRGADNDHVFRNRAPLFIAQVDPKKLQVMRATERVIVPEKGARLGNFGVVDFGPDETWVTVTEWMQPIGVEKYGSDNRIFIAKLKWSRSNRLCPPNP